MIDYIGMFEKVAAITARRIPASTFYKRLDAKAAFNPRNKDLYFGLDGTVVDYKKVNPSLPGLGRDQANAIVVSGRPRVNYKGYTSHTFERPKDVTKSVAFRKPRHIRLAEKGYGRFLPAETKKLGETRFDVMDRLLNKEYGIKATSASLPSVMKDAVKHQWNTSPTFRANVAGSVGQAVALASNLF